MLFRYRLTTSYDGSCYHGLQVQNHNDNTIAKAITDAASSLIANDTKLVFASRTDVGTHAIGQVFHIDCLKEYKPDSIGASINSNLIKNDHRIVITNVERVSSSFNARSSVLEKTYLYRVVCNKFRPVLESDRSWHIYKALDLSITSELMRKFVTPKKDFRGFSHKIATDVNSMRSLREIVTEITDYRRGTFKRIKVTLSGKEIDIDESYLSLASDLTRYMNYECEIKLYFTAKSFLRHQVRLIVGSMVQSMTKTIDSAIIDQIFLTGSKPTYIITAPASGLYLLSIKY